MTGSAINLESKAIVRVLSAIEAMKEPWTVTELSARAHYDVNRLRSIVIPALIDLGKVHVTGWRPAEKGRWPALHLAGKGVPPQRKPWSKRKLKHARDYRKAKGYYARQSANRTAARTLQRVAKAPSLFLAVLGG